MSDKAKRTILVAEDEPLLRELASEGLSSIGYEVLLASDGVEAIRQLRAHPEIDVVLMDVIMPGMSGTDAFQGMREFRPGLRGVFVSGYAPESTNISRLLEDEGVRFLSKPVSLVTLAAALDELLDSTPESETSSAKPILPS